MKNMKARACSICQKPLKWWNTQSCMKCGHIICKQHAHTIRRPRSSVIFSFCTHCALQAAKRRVNNPNSQPGVLPTNKTKDSLLSSLSGISFSGISFSGISLPGISFSGLKREKHQSNDQSDPTDTSQTEQSDTPPSEPETPPAEPHQDDEQTE